MKIIKRLFLTIVVLLLVGLLLFNVYNFINIKVLKKDLTSVFGYSLLEVVSGSMEPTIHVGDLILIDTKDSVYHVNDIVTFKDVNGDFVTHRILHIEEGEMVTKGDNNNTEDSAMSTKDIVGKYLFRIPNAGKVMASFKTPFVMGMVLVIGVLICFLVSTDKNGNPILTENEKELKEFQEYQKKKEIQKERKEISEEKQEEKIEEKIDTPKKMNNLPNQQKQSTNSKNNNRNKKKNSYKKKKRR